MEPRPLDRGNSARITRRPFGFVASMEPRPLDRGNQSGKDRQSSHFAELQWSRDLSIAETVSSLNYVLSAIWALCFEHVRLKLKSIKFTS